MKKKLCVTSASLFVLWLVGFFMFGFSSVVHGLLWVAVIIFIRSLFICNDSVAIEKSK